MTARCSSCGGSLRYPGYRDCADREAHRPRVVAQRTHARAGICDVSNLPAIGPSMADAGWREMCRAGSAMLAEKIDALVARGGC